MPETEYVAPFFRLSFPVQALLVVLATLVSLPMLVVLALAYVSTLAPWVLG